MYIVDSKVLQSIGLLRWRLMALLQVLVVTEQLVNPGSLLSMHYKVFSCRLCFRKPAYSNCAIKGGCISQIPLRIEAGEFTLNDGA